MLSLSSTAATCSPSICARAPCFSPSKYIHPQNPRKSARVFRIFSLSFTTSATESVPNQSHELHNGESGNYAGVQLQEIVDKKSPKLRIDTWISSRIGGVSRARVQSSIRAGLVTVNGGVIDKVSHVIRAGDKVNCTISELQPLSAKPEDIPLDIVYEDAHVLLVNKPAHMVVHPAPGNANGTLVNGILHHCSLPTMPLENSYIISEDEEDSDVEFSGSLDDRSSCMTNHPNMVGNSVRPGIVHRLDKGTSGLLVVAKDEHSHAHLSEQFKQHTIQRVYISLTSGVPATISGRIDVPIGRDVNKRIRMVAVSAHKLSGGFRHAATWDKVSVSNVGSSGSIGSANAKSEHD